MNPVDAMKKKIERNKTYADEIRAHAERVIDALPNDGEDAVTTLTAVVGMMAMINEGVAEGRGEILIHEIATRALMSLQASLEFQKEITNGEKPHDLH